MDRLNISRIKQNAGKFRQTFSNTLNDLLHLAGGKDDEHEHGEDGEAGGQEEAAGAASHARPEGGDDDSERERGRNFLRDAWNAYTVQGREGAVFCDVLDALSKAYDEGSTASSPASSTSPGSSSSPGKRVNLPCVPKCVDVGVHVQACSHHPYPLQDRRRPVDVGLALGPQNGFGSELAKRIAESCEAILRTVGADGCDIFAEVPRRSPYSVLSKP
jgi:hypothetical protein